MPTQIGNANGDPYTVLTIPSRPKGVILLPPIPNMTSLTPFHIRKAAAEKNAREMHIGLIQISIRSLPAKFQEVCPFSLTSQNCTVKGCILYKVCGVYNDEKATESAAACPGDCNAVHLQKTCISEIDAVPNQCTIAVDAANDKDNLSKSKEEHMAKRAHYEPSQEWLARRLLADLRYVHAAGRWGIQG
jgi:hypothetical protein